MQFIAETLTVAISFLIQVAKRVETQPPPRTVTKTATRRDDDGEKTQLQCIWLNN